MVAEIKALWLKALRSGEYKHADGSLRDGDTFCFLGVLCDLYRAIHQGACWRGNLFFVGPKALPGACYYPPIEVREWAGLIDMDPVLGESLGENSSSDTAAEANDEGVTFAKIADAIEQTL